MENDEEKFWATHKGWLLFCPVWVKDPDRDCEIMARWRMDWLLFLAMLIGDWLLWLSSFFVGQPMWPLLVRQLDPPRFIRK